MSQTQQGKNEMIHLQSQEQLEEFISKNPKVPHNDVKIIYFTANWCGACKRVDFNSIFDITKKTDKIKWYICDIDQNDYSAGYCGVKTIPAFLAIINGKPQPLLSTSDTQQIIIWIKSGFKQ